VGDLVYIGSCAGKFWALDWRSGEVRWSYDITQDGDQLSFHGNPLVTDSLILTGADGQGIGHLYAFDQRSGAVRWMYPDVRGYTSDLIRHGDHVYAASLADELICVDISSGELVWYFSDTTGSSGPFSSSPAIAGNRIFFGSRTGYVYALSADSGHVIWSQDVGALVSTAIVLGDDDLFMGTKAGYIYRLNQDDGRVLDTLALGAPDSEERLGTIGNPLLAEDLLLVLWDGAKELVAIGQSDMRVQWRLPTETEWSSYRPYHWHDYVLVGDQDGILNAVDPASGEIVWSEEFEGTIRGIGSQDNVIFVGTLQGMVYAWDAGADTEEK
jgi:outer membrane protein assembly factor BamB